MVLDRRGVLHGTQEGIGYDLGLVVPREDALEFKNVRTGRKPAGGYGTQVAKKQYSINHYFCMHRIPLIENYFPPTIKNYGTFINDNIRKSNDLLVCFNNKTLFGAGDYGHVCAIQRLVGDTVTLMDPNRNVPKRRRVELPLLITAMQTHGVEKRGGFWVISQDGQ